MIRVPPSMPRPSRERTDLEPRFPKGTIVLVLLAAVLIAGLYLIIDGLG